MSSHEPDRRSTAFVAGSVPENYESRLAPIIFEPWAEILIESVGVGPGDQVLDIASGTGVVARQAARHAGAGGRVVASDVSAAMLAHAATRPSPPDAAPIEYLEAAAGDLGVPDGSFDVVLCQQGLPFFTDRPGAAREMRRVLRAGGKAGVAVWVAGRRLEPFDDYAEALSAAGVPPPYPQAYDTSSFVMSAPEVTELYEGAGFSAVDVSVVDQTIGWASAEAAAAGILGTPFGPVVAGLPADQRQALDAELIRRFGVAGEPVRRSTAAVIARATV